MRRMARKANISATISSMAKKINPVPTAADGRFAVSKVNAARFFAPLANPIAFQDNSCLTLVRCFVMQDLNYSIISTT